MNEDRICIKCEEPEDEHTLLVIDEQDFLDEGSKVLTRLCPSQIEDIDTFEEG